MKRGNTRSRFSQIVSMLTIPVFLLGCSIPFRPGLVEGAAPPRLITIDGKAGWDNPGAFGPVPAELQATGDEVCSSLNAGWRTYRATGYHSRAQDVDGNAFPRGAYFCK
jgi:hypothetical protein